MTPQMRNLDPKPFPLENGKSPGYKVAQITGAANLAFQQALRGVLAAARKT